MNFIMKHIEKKYLCDLFIDARNCCIKIETDEPNYYSHADIESECICGCVNICWLSPPLSLSLPTHSRRSEESENSAECAM